MATKKPTKNKFLQGLVNKYTKRKVAGKVGKLGKLKLASKAKKKAAEAVKKP